MLRTILAHFPIRFQLESSKDFLKLIKEMSIVLTIEFFP